MRYLGDETGRQIPDFAVPPYRGDRYRSLVPDTLDLQERARLAVNGLTGPTDPKKDHLLYFNADFRTHPPVMWHRGSDICQTKFEESLPLMRLASGSAHNDHVDPVWMALALRQIGPDGLCYWPLLPWIQAVDWGRGYPGGTALDRRAGHYSVPLFCGRRGPSRGAHGPARPRRRPPDYSTPKTRYTSSIGMPSSRALRSSFSLAKVASARSSTSSTMAAGMSWTPSLSPKTKSPGITRT
jgi:hypothetical protein